MEIRPIVRKVELLPLIQILQMLYDNGLDFVDLNGKLGEEGDVLNLSFTKEYMNEDHSEDFDELIENEENIETKDVKLNLTEDDVNNLL